MLQKLDFNFNVDHIPRDATTVREEDGYKMLVTVPHIFWKDIAGNEELCVFFYREVEPGIYETGYNFEHDINEFTKFKVIGNGYERLGNDGLPKEFNFETMKGQFNEYFESTREPYGVADNVEQIKEFYKDQIASNASIVISISEIRKDRQPANGGWRWHKWGEYIGTQNRQCEYIYDEPEVDSVYVFHAYSVQPNK